MKISGRMKRRDFGRLAFLAAALSALLPFRRRRRKAPSPGKSSSRIPEKPFREKDLWTPHDFAG